MLQIRNLLISAKLKDNSINTIVDGVSLDVKRGEKLAIIGKSGSGKTMTGLAILGLLPDNVSAYGIITWDGINLLELSKKERRDKLGRLFAYIPQSGVDFLNPSLTVKKHFEEEYKKLNVKTNNASGLLRSFGFDNPDNVLNAYPFQLSGGMAQRVVMALSLVSKPQLVIADEPTRGIDRDNIKVFLNNLNKYYSESAVIVITHDMNVASEMNSIYKINEVSKNETRIQ